MYLPEFMTVAGQPVPASRIRHRLVRMLIRQGYARSADSARVYCKGQEVERQRFRNSVQGCGVAVILRDARQQEAAGHSKRAREAKRQARALKSPEAAVWVRLVAVHVLPALPIYQEETDDT